MAMSTAMKRKFNFGLRGIVFGAVIGAFAITAATAISTSANAGENDIAVPAGKLNWVPFGDSPAKMVVLWGDPASGEYAVLLKLPPGFTPGPHSHTFAYHGVNLQGTWTHIFGNDDVRSLPPACITYEGAGNDLTSSLPKMCVQVPWRLTP